MDEVGRYNDEVDGLTTGPAWRTDGEERFAMVITDAASAAIVSAILVGRLRHQRSNWLSRPATMHRGQPLKI
ncbi:hypothetical protein [Sphingomonas sp. PB4P5]|uniref:hypothetical protein n=1 Tax=Parasphingomonas puruogangriensis TaxID=3096155 RepID=UPI002FC63FB6